jgi:5-methyltetrahydrofolate--homocysteine methyltransferase
MIMTVREQLNAIARERVLILDGAMGSLIHSLKLDENSFHARLFKNCNDFLCLAKPDAIRSIHEAYLEAGADIIETCSFNSTSVSLSDYGIGNKAYEISVKAAIIARESAHKFAARGKPRFVAGSIGPTAKGASLYPDINNPGKRSILWDELEESYYDNARGLLDGSADILIVETIFDTLNLKAALSAIGRLIEERKTDVPVIISAAVSGEAGRLLSGQNLEAFVASALHINPWAVGLNCSFDAKKLLPLVRLMSANVPCLVSAYPNAGLPDSAGKYAETPEIMAGHVEEYLKEGLVNVIGGCCGTTPAHIAAIAEKAAKYPPRGIPAKKSGAFFSGLEPLFIESDTVPVKNPDTDGRKEFLRALASGEYEDAADSARDMIDAGVSVLNIETDDEEAASKFLDHALMNPYIAKVPFMINSGRFEVIETALKRIQGRGFAGPVSLKDGGEEFLRKARLILRYGAAAVVALTDEKGEADTGERKIEIANRAYGLLKENGYPPDNIVFDLDAPQLVRDNCPGVLFAI